MPDLKLLFTGLVAIGLATTLVLPKRQTVAVSNSLFKGTQGLFATVMGTSRDQRLVA